MSDMVLSYELNQQLADQMQKGYSEAKRGNKKAASDSWKAFWNDIKAAMRAHSIASVEKMDRVFAGKESLYNWSTDFEMALFNASKHDQRYLSDRIAFCQEYIAHSDNKDQYNNLVRRRCIADSYVMLGDFERGEQLYQKLVEQYPYDGWSWINFSDLYGVFAQEDRKDYDKAISLLKEGLRVSNQKDKADILDRLGDIYDALGMQDKAAEVKYEVEAGKMKKEPSTTVKSQKVGRNERCPCGSGKKYKKCCGGS